MIVILYQHGCGTFAKKAATDLRKAFANSVKVGLVGASSSSSWPGDVSWDDLLIVMYGGNDFPAKGNAFINQYLKKRGSSAILLPVAVDLSVKKPPKAAAAIKALEYDPTARGPKGKLVNRVGGMLGLLVQGRNAKIFISYRASDGTAIAVQLYDHLVSLGHNVFLDEAREIDGYTKILPGSPVQTEIDEALDKSNLLLLIDTPSAPDSKWIVREVETADSLLLPILPICFRDKGDPKQGPRFQSLLALQRWVQFEGPHAAASLPLSAHQLEQTVTEAEKYLCQIFQRKCRVPFIVEKEFVSRGFAWSVLDQRLLMFKSSRGKNWRVRTNVLSHCSVFDPNYSPAMQRFGAYLKATRRHNHSLFLYDGELLPESQLQKIVEQAEDESVIVLHHQELAALIDSNFTNLPAAA